MAERDSLHVRRYEELLQLDGDEDRDSRTESAAVRSMPAGSVALTVQQDGGAISRSAGHLTIVPAIEYLPNSTVTGGAVIRVDTYGLAARTA